MRFRWLSSLPVFPVILSLALGASTPAAADLCPSDVVVPVDLSIYPQNPCAGDEVHLVVTSCAPCVHLIGIDPDSLIVKAQMDLRLCLLRVPCIPETLGISLGKHAAGSYVLNVSIVAGVINRDSSICIAQRIQQLAFQVRRDCSRDSLPYLDEVQIGIPVVCIRAPCPPLVCPNVPNPIALRGHFDNDCLAFQGVEAVIPVAGPIPAPPSLRIIYTTNDCLGRACSPGYFPWATALGMPPLPPGSYELPIQAVLVHYTCIDSVVEPLGSIRVPFTVSQGCPLPNPQCFNAEWHGAFDANPCEAFVGPNHPATLTLELAPNVGMAGFQGELVLDSLALRITNLAAVGPASGMHLDWRETERGARFVMFAEHGAPIPPHFIECVHCGWPVLEVQLESRSGGPLPRVTHLIAHELLGSDSLGNGVGECPILYPGPFNPLVARICAGGRCDFNGDGNADVRDLVLMVHCILGGGPCPNPSLGDLDCNGDSLATIDDVLCCARVVLGGDHPDTTRARPEPNVHVVMGEPLREGDRVDVPVTVEGAHLLGAARLAINFPSERYEVESVELVGSPADWLELHEVRGGELIEGLIGLSQNSRSNLELKIRLRLRQGMPAGGQVGLASADFASPEGTTLQVVTGQPTRSLGKLVRLALSSPRPNPFNGSAAFAITLAQASDLRVTVYDLAGREVKELFRGQRPAGTLDLVWDGTASGKRQRGGLYFIRASGAGEIVARKVVLLGRP